MLQIIKNCIMTSTLMIISVSCFYMQTNKTTENQKLIDDNKTNFSEKKNMNDIFKISETVEKTFSVSPNTTLNITNFEGGISVRSKDIDVVQIKVTKIALDKDASEGVKYNFSQSNGTIDLMADFVKPNRKIPYGKGYFYSKGAYVNWEIIIPVNANLSVKTEEGKIMVSDIKGNITLDTKDGSIDVKNCKGNLQASTYDGIVKISKHNGTANIVNRSDDSIVVEGDFSDLFIETGGGDIFIGVPISSGGIIESDSESISATEITLKKNGQSLNGLQQYSFGTGSSTFKLKSNTGKVSVYKY